MFLAYWPVLAFVAALIVSSIFLTLFLADKICRARHRALPERSLESYLPQQVRYINQNKIVFRLTFPQIRHFRTMIPLASRT